MRHLAIIFVLSLVGMQISAADTIYFKDGMKTICQTKAWEEDGEIKCEYQGAILSYKKEDVLQIKKAFRESSDASTEADSIASPSPATFSTAKAGQESYSQGPVFYDPRREYEYWASETSRHKTFSDAINALAKQYDRSPAWIQSQMGDSNDLHLIHRNLKNGPEDKDPIVESALQSDLKGQQFYNPRREHVYWVSATSKHNSFEAAISALAERYQRSPDWIRKHMGQSNDLSKIHRNLKSRIAEEPAP